MQKPVAAEDDAAVLPMRIGKQSRSFRLRTTPMRDSEADCWHRHTLEDVTTLQDTDRFKTQFIAVASRKLRDRCSSYAAVSTRWDTVRWRVATAAGRVVTAASNDSEKLDDLMGDLIEVAELDTGKRELHLERVRPLPMLNEARDRYCDEASEKHIRMEVQAYADLSFISATGVRCAPFSTIAIECSPYTRPKANFCSPRRRSRTLYSSPCGTLAGALKRAACYHLRPLQRLLRNRHWPGPRIGSAAGRVARRQIAVESRLGHGTTFRFTVPVAVLESVVHPVEVG